MKAVLVREPGGADQLELGTAPTPEPGPDELLVRVHATALNRPDILQRQGKYPPPKGASPLLGLEVAGTVDVLGANCREWNIGDRVFGLMGGGGYAEYAVLHRDLAMRVPEGLSMEEAAAIPEVFLTAFQSLYWLGQFEQGSRVLIHAGASGVGTAAIQLVRAGGGHAYVTASAGKLDVCRRLGAEVAIDYRSERFADRILAETGDYGVDIILDFIGAPYFTDNIEALARDGRLIILATMGGVKVPEFDLRPLFRRRGQVITSTLRTRSVAYQARLTQDFSMIALPLFTGGRLRAVIDSVYDWKDVADAHRRMEANENVGKIVLRVS